MYKIEYENISDDEKKILNEILSKIYRNFKKKGYKMNFILEIFKRN